MDCRSCIMFDLSDITIARICYKRKKINFVK